jgi:agmatine deiminase
VTFAHEAGLFPIAHARCMGYSMPAEWARHPGDLLSWPHNSETCPTYLLNQVRNLAANDLRFAPTNGCACSIERDKTEREVSARLPSVEKAHGKYPAIADSDGATVWMRDYGPTFVTRAATADPLAFNDWIFNGWGGKYPPIWQGDRIAKNLPTVKGSGVRSRTDLEAVPLK